MARANKGPTKPRSPDQDPARKQQPGAQDAGKDGDALAKDGNVDDQKLKDNQDHLGVGNDHKTEDMRKKHRGTFP
jgi:hypothetical protein